MKRKKKKTLERKKYAPLLTLFIILKERFLILIFDLHKENFYRKAVIKNIRQIIRKTINLILKTIILTLLRFKCNRRKDKDVFARHRIIIDCNLCVRYLLLRYIFSETKCKA